MSRKRKKTTSRSPTQKPKSAANDARVRAMVAKVGKLMKQATDHHQRREYSSALGCYRQVLTIQPMNTMALNNLGLIRKALGEPRVAEEIIRMAVNLDPKNPDFHFNLGNTLREDNRFPAAIEEYRIALRLNPEYFNAWLNLGDCLRIMADYDTASQAFSRAMQLHPDNSDVKLNQANLFLEMGDGEKAASMYQEIIKIKADDARLYSNCGTALKQIGKLREAADFYRQAVNIDPNMVGAIYNAVNLDKTEADDPWFELLNNLKQDPRVALHEKAGLCFALGKMYDDIGEYDTAFINYRDGNALRDQQAARLNRKFVAEKHRQVNDAIINTYSPQQFKKVRPLGALGDDEFTPIIIVGMPRSGTTLTEQILASHPRVSGAGELPDIAELAARIDPRDDHQERLPYPQNVELLDEARAIELASRYLARLRELCADSPRVVDKMPGNFNYLGFFAHLFPAAKIIDCRRDPMDNCLSCYIQNFSRRHEYSNDLTQLAFVYKEYERIMDYWNKHLPVKIFRSQYEDLVENNEESVRKLLQFCELDWDDGVLEFYKTKRNIQTASVVQVRQPLYKSAIRRWKHYEKHLKPLIDGLGIQDQEETTTN